MSAPAPSLTNEEYEQRRKLFEDIKTLTKAQQVQIYTILAETSSDFSQNSNGVFFDVAKLSKAAFEAILQYLQFCKTIRKDEEVREEEERQAQDRLR
jgi:hypothetical protein